MSIHVFLHSCYADWEIGYLLPELVEQNRPVTTFGLTQAPVKSLGGLTVTPDRSFGEIDRTKVEALILPGGDFWPTFVHDGFTNFVCDLVASRTPIGGICAATSYLARIGLLDRVAHTSNDLNFLQTAAPKYKGTHLYEEKLAVSSGDVITASGFGAVEFTYELLKRLQVYGPTDCERWFKAFKHGELTPDA